MRNFSGPFLLINMDIVSGSKSTARKMNFFTDYWCQECKVPLAAMFDHIPKLKKLSLKCGFFQLTFKRSSEKQIIHSLINKCILLIKALSLGSQRSALAFSKEWIAEGKGLNLNFKDKEDLRYFEIFKACKCESLWKFHFGWNCSRCFLLHQQTIQFRFLERKNLGKCNELFYMPEICVR